MLRRRRLAIRYWLEDQKRGQRIMLVITLMATTSLIWYNNINEYNQLMEAKQNTFTIYEQVIESRNAGVVEAAIEVTPEQTGENTEIDTPQVVSVQMSAYTSREQETDDSPCISASGDNICEMEGCIVAYNALPLGSHVQVEGFGDCIVLDRMNSRYGENNMDMYFHNDLAGALQFGRRTVSINF